MTDEPVRSPKDGFWAVWVVLIFLVTLTLIFLTGCEEIPQDDEANYKVITQEEKSQLLVKKLMLPTSAKNVVVLNDGWHTFELVLDGRTRKFLRRYIPQDHHSNYSHLIDTVTEIKPQ